MRFLALLVLLLTCAGCRAGFDYVDEGVTVTGWEVVPRAEARLPPGIDHSMVLGGGDHLIMGTVVNETSQTFRQVGLHFIPDEEAHGELHIMIVGFRPRERRPFYSGVTTPEGWEYRGAVDYSNLLP